jgi:glucose-1-phosphate cytidylyltransferase
VIETVRRADDLELIGTFFLSKWPQVPEIDCKDWPETAINLQDRRGKPMKVAILAGGKGTRLAEETEIRPKPMVTIGGRPILWHIMKHYAHYGHKEFYLALGYKGEVIKRYIIDHTSLQGDLTVDLGKGSVHQSANGMHELDWIVHLMETGEETQTGGRIKRLAPHIGRETFMLTWGDGVSNVDLHKLLAFHRSHGRLATITAVRPPAR